MSSRTGAYGSRLGSGMKGRPGRGPRYGGGAPAIRSTMFTARPYVRRFPATSSSDAYLRGRRTGKSEVKVVDVPVTNYNLNSTAVVTLVGAVQQGAAVYQRIGSEIQYNSVYINGLIINTGAVVVNNDYTRIMLVYDRQPATAGGGVPAISEILQTVDQAGSPSTESYSGTNILNRKRFAILMDERYMLPPSTAGNAASTNPQPSIDYKIKRYIKLKQLEAEFKSTANPMTVGNITTGAFYFVTFGNEASGGWAVQAEMRFTYTD
nr:MAG: capsid protein [Cressdnaviricota sp.]